MWFKLEIVNGLKDKQKIQQIKEHEDYKNTLSVCVCSHDPGSLEYPVHKLSTMYMGQHLSHNVCECTIIKWGLILVSVTRPHSAVGNMSGNRCESDCRSRGRKFDPGPVLYFRGD